MDALPSAKLGELLQWLAPGVTAQQLLSWPPDVLALSLAVLHKSGAYIGVVMPPKWPPPSPLWFKDKERKRPEADSWPAAMRFVGVLWRNTVERENSVGETSGRIPRLLRETVQVWLDELLSCHNEKLGTIPETIAVNLVQLVAAADEACKGFGLGLGDPKTLLSRGAQQLLATGGRTLCRFVRPEVFVVLPKQHTPQTGLTIRSLTHNLAGYWTGEIRGVWRLVGANLTSVVQEELNTSLETIASAVGPQATRPRNVLILPWPLKLHKRQFVAATTAKDAPDYGTFGLFSYRPDPSETLPDKLSHFERVLMAATKEVGVVDGVVLPELALWGDDEVKALSDHFLAYNSSGFFVAGYGKSGVESAHGDLNRASLCYKSAGVVINDTQAKHHRWQLDRAQIENFGLGSSLNPFMRWWEHIQVESRCLTFFTFAPTLTLTVLICEDLARQEPASELLRSIGANLVIALLMDGPQLQSRWPSRYATILADDPGSSVLTVTSLGMAEMSRPAGKPTSRVIAQWKDPVSGVAEIALAPESEAVVLSLANRMMREWTADKRQDEGSANFLALSGVHQIARA